MKRQATNNELAVTVGVIVSKVDTIQSDIKEIKAKLEKDFASKEWVMSRYDTARNIMYGIVSILCVAVLGAIISLVIRK